jgi:hypothetical protein
VNGEDLRPLAERSWALEDKTPGRLVDVHARIATARRRRRSTITLLSVASVLVVLALTLVLVDTGPDSTPDPAPAPSPSFTPDPTPAPNAAVHRPAEGTCWAVPADQVAYGTQWQDDSPQVPCRQQHTTETVAVLALAEPTVEEAEKRAVDMCWEYVRLYVGIDERSWIPWGMTAFLPSDEQIADGASWIRCDAMFPDGADWDRGRAVTGSAEGLADDPPPEYWACFGNRPDPGSEPPPVPCDRPHAYEQTGRLALLSRLDEYPTKQEREIAEVQCEAGVPPRLQGYPFYIAWDPPDDFEPNGDVAGPCYVHDPSGAIPPRPAGGPAR